MNFLALIGTLTITAGVGVAPGLLFSKVTKAKTYNYNRTSDNQIKSYYSGLTEGMDKKSALTKLESILKNSHTKTNYTSGDSTSSAWHGYYLFERNFSKSPLTESEKSGQYKKSGIWLNVLYCKSPIYISTSIKYGATFKYLDDNGNERTGTFNQSNTYFDREHIFAKSHGMNSESYSYDTLDCGTDIHNLHISDKLNNTNHSSYAYADLTTYTNSKPISDNFSYPVTTSGTVGQNNGYTVYEPQEKDKGVIARSILYMAARYHTFDDSTSNIQPSLALTDNLGLLKSVGAENTRSEPAYYGHLSTLLKWNKEHPVTENERWRNDLIYNNFQHNRNPFVDFPHWADFFFNPSYTPEEGQSAGLSYTIPKNYTETASTFTVSLRKTNDWKDSYELNETLPSTSYSTTVFNNIDGSSVENPKITYLLNGEEITSDTKLTKSGENTLQARFDEGVDSYLSNKLTFTVKGNGNQNSEIKEIDLKFVLIIGGIIIGVILLLVIFVAIAKNKKANDSVPKSKSKKGFENKIFTNKQIKTIKSKAKKALKEATKNKK